MSKETNEFPKGSIQKTNFPKDQYKRKQNQTTKER